MFHPKEKRTSGDTGRKARAWTGLNTVVLFFFLNCIMTGIENQTINKQKTTLYVFQWKIEPVSRAATRCDGLAHFFWKFPIKNGILGLNKPTQQLV